MKMKKRINILAVLICIWLALVALPAKADSGWDSSYDSGGWDSGGWDSGSYDSGSSWDFDSSSSWSSGSSSSSSSSHSSNGSILPFLFFLMFSIYMLLMIASYLDKKNEMDSKERSRNSMDNYKSKVTDYDDLDINKLKEIDPNIEIDKMKEEVFRVYKELQTAWMNFDYETIRKLVTDELYNMYISQLETLKLKKQKNIMDEIELVDCKIRDISKDADTITLKVFLEVKCFDFVINTETNEVVRGKNNEKLIIQYNLFFIKSATDNDNIEICPNCGAEVDIRSSATCPYCKSVLVKTGGTYVLSKKNCIWQEREKR